MRFMRLQTKTPVECPRPAFSVGGLLEGGCRPVCASGLKTFSLSSTVAAHSATVSQYAVS